MNARAAGVWGALRQRIAEERRRRVLVARTSRALTPPGPSAFAAFGPGSWIVPPARISSPECISIGRDVVVHEHSWLSVVEAHPETTPRLVIGDRTRIGRFCSIACVGEVVVEEDVLAADFVFLADSYHRYDDPRVPVIRQPMSAPEPVVVRRGSFLGIGAIVLPGVTVGEHAYVGAGAVVTRDVPPFSVVVGNPARVVRRVEQGEAPDGGE